MHHSHSSSVHSNRIRGSLWRTWQAKSNAPFDTFCPPSPRCRLQQWDEGQRLWTLCCSYKYILMGENAEPQVSLTVGLTSQSGFVGPLTRERIRPCSCELAFARLSARNDWVKVAALNRYFCRHINPESWKDPLRCFLMGAACSTPSPVQAFIVTPSDLLTSYATVRWQRASLSSHFPEHSGSVTKSSFTSRSCRCSLPAKNKEDKVQSDQGHTQWHGAVWEHTSIKLHVSPKHSNVRRLKLGDLNFAKTSSQWNSPGARM